MKVNDTLRSWLQQNVSQPDGQLEQAKKAQSIEFKKSTYANENQIQVKEGGVVDIDPTAMTPKEAQRFAQLLYESGAINAEELSRVELATKHLLIDSKGQKHLLDRPDEPINFIADLQQKLHVYQEEDDTKNTQTLQSLLSIFEKIAKARVSTRIDTHA